MAGLGELKQMSGPVQYATPRAVQVSAPNEENALATQQAIYGSVAIHVNTQTERDRILSRWNELMEYFADGVKTFLDDEQDAAEQGG